MGRGAVGQVLVAAGGDVLLVVEELPEDSEDVAELAPFGGAFGRRAGEQRRHAGDHREGGAGLAAVGGQHRLATRRYPRGATQVGELTAYRGKSAGGQLGCQRPLYGAGQARGTEQAQREQCADGQGGQRRLGAEGALAGDGLPVREVVHAAGGRPPQQVHRRQRERGLRVPGLRAVDRQGQDRQGVPQRLPVQQLLAGGPQRPAGRAGRLECGGHLGLDGLGVSRVQVLVGQGGHCCSPVSHWVWSGTRFEHR